MDPERKPPNFLDLLREMLEDHLGKAEFVAAFENVVKRVEQIDERTAKEVDQIATTLRTMFDELKTGNSGDVTTFKEELRKLFADENKKALQSLQTAIDAANERVAELQDGEDADEDAIAERVKAEIIEPITDSMMQQLPAAGAAIRDGLELLVDDERLDVAAIRGLDEWLQKNVGEIRSSGQRVGWGAHPIRISGLGVVIDKNVRAINFKGTGLTSISRDSEGVVQVTLGGGTASLTPIALTGTIDDSNVTFTAASEPTFLVINGGIYQKTGGAITWTYVAGTITTSAPVGSGGSIYGL